MQKTSIRRRPAERVHLIRSASTHWRWLASTGFIWCVVFFGLLLMPVLVGVASYLWATSLAARPDWELCIAGLVVLSGLFVASCQVTRSIVAETRSYLPVHPDVYRNAHLMPAEETLMRAADIPLEQQQELLRPVAENAIPPNQLLRAYSPEEIEERAYAFRLSRWKRAEYDRLAGLAAVLTASQGITVPHTPGKALYYEPDQRRRPSGDIEESERASGE